VTSPNPLKMDEPELEALYKAVGFFIIQRVSAEQSLDLAVALLYREHGGNAIAKKLPKPLEAKLKFVRRSLDSLPQLAPLRTIGLALAMEFERLSQSRHDLIHGAISSVAPIGSAFRFAKLDFVDPHIHTFREFDFDAADFPRISGELIILGANTINFVRVLLDEWDHDPHKK
jgi:hypothetical protein